MIGLFFMPYQPFPSHLKLKHFGCETHLNLQITAIILYTSVCLQLFFSFSCLQFKKFFFLPEQAAKEIPSFHHFFPQSKWHELSMRASDFIFKTNF